VSCSSKPISLTVIPLEMVCQIAAHPNKQLVHLPEGSLWLLGIKKAASIFHVAAFKHINRSSYGCGLLFF